MNSISGARGAKIAVSRKLAVAITVLASVVLCLIIQNARAASVTFEAESGALGSDFTNEIDGAVQYISISTDIVNGGNPGDASRMASYTVTFPEAGTYNLYARVLVGSNGFDDDSMFYGNGFGVKSPVTDGDWITMNGLAALELAYVASGRLDLYVERTINLWDIAAGALMVECSGGECWLKHLPDGRFRMCADNGRLRKKLHLGSLLK